MTDFNGYFVWHELMTSDPDAAKAFYGQVVGWTFEDMPMPGMTYALVKAGAAQVAGIMGTPDEAKANGVPPHWMGYVAVEDVDATAAKAESLGGSILRPGDDIPGVGRFAIITDPYGAAIALFKPLPPDPAIDCPPAEPGSPGAIGWNELYTGDLDGAVAFYQALFGWRRTETIDMGEMGLYQLYAKGENDLGGMMKQPPQMPVSTFVYYFVVGDIDAAAARVKAGGGTVAMGPMEVPGGQWIVQAIDPQGAFFALVGSR